MTTTRLHRLPVAPLVTLSVLLALMLLPISGWR